MLVPINVVANRSKLAQDHAATGAATDRKKIVAT
jgi:hypothetical protein